MIIQRAHPKPSGQITDVMIAHPLALQQSGFLGRSQAFNG